MVLLNVIKIYSFIVGFAIYSQLSNCIERKRNHCMCVHNLVLLFFYNSKICNVSVTLSILICTLWPPPIDLKIIDRIFASKHKCTKCHLIISRQTHRLYLKSILNI